MLFACTWYKVLNRLCQGEDISAKEAEEFLTVRNMMFI